VRGPLEIGTALAEGHGTVAGDGVAESTYQGSPEPR
jgi:hypothetical protein